MNSAQAKQLSLPNILARLGYEPVRVLKDGQELWYQSPFRAEKEPSFHTSFLGGKWIWNDFGDTGGTVIDFVMRYKGYRSVKEALAWLDDMPRAKPRPLPPPEKEAEPSLFSFQQQSGAAAPVEDRQLELISAKPVSHPTILSYLIEERKIPESLLKRYLVEVAYKNIATGKEYFAFGMRNETGGYEIRVASSKYDFKSALPARDITLIRGTQPGSGIVNIFEGMTDYLSLLVMLRAEFLKGDSLIMHSLTSYNRTAEILRREGYQTLNTFLDNDHSGREATEKFRAEFGTGVISQSEMFAGYKDLNAALCANPSPTKTNDQPSPAFNYGRK